VANGSEDDIACPVRENLPILRDERDEMSLRVALQMRKIAPIKRHEVLPQESLRDAYAIV
jgi:hypothetical protein